VVERSKTPLFYASGYGKVASVQLLIEHGAQVNALNGLGKFLSKEQEEELLVHIDLISSQSATPSTI